MNILRTVPLGVVLVVLLTSCVAQTKSSDEKDANGKKIEYVYYTPIGSNVPIRVPRQVVDAANDDSTTATSKKSFEDIQRNGSASLPQDPGGK